MNESRCPRCFLLRSYCICPHIPQLDTQVRVCLIRHVGERHKTTNSARLAHVALRNSEMLDYGERDRPLPPLPQEEAFLLFPPALDHSGQPAPDGPPVHDLSQGPPPSVCRHLLILDGTWAQARRMSHRLTEVARLPRLMVSQRPARPRARRPPGPDTFATLEAIGHALWYLEGPGVGEALLELFDQFVEAYHRQCNKPLPSL